MRCKDLIDLKGPLPINELNRPHWLEGILSNWWGICTSLTWTNPFRSMRSLKLINHKESFPIDEVFAPHWPEGIPSGQWGLCNSSIIRNPFQSMSSLHLIDWKGSLPIDEVHDWRGFLLVRWEQLPNPPRKRGDWGSQLPKNKGKNGGTNPKSGPQISWQLPMDVHWRSLGFFGVVFTSP
jgi:hypothetical protein